MDCIQERNVAYNAVRSALGTKEVRELSSVCFYFFLNLIIITEIVGVQRVLITFISLLFYEAIFFEKQTKNFNRDILIKLITINAEWKKSEIYKHRELPSFLHGSQICPS